MPLRRVAQAYVVATKTKVDISTLELPENLNDEFFKRSKPEKKKKDSDIFSDTKKVITVEPLISKNFSLLRIQSRDLSVLSSPVVYDDPKGSTIEKFIYGCHLLCRNIPLVMSARKLRRRLTRC